MIKKKVGFRVKDERQKLRRKLEQVTDQTQLMQALEDYALVLRDHKEAMKVTDDNGCVQGIKGLEMQLIGTSPERAKNFGIDR